MNYNQKTLELEPHLSKLIDSLCFELAVNIPDENSLSLLEILQMRKAEQINQEQLKQLYKDWLQSKNVYDILTAKQVKVYPKGQLIVSPAFKKHLNQGEIIKQLQLLNNLYNGFYLSKKSSDQRYLHQVEDLFDMLDSNGNIHLGPSQLFFLTAAFLIYESASIPLNYQQFKPAFKQKNKELCQIEGMVSLRWFKNYFISKSSSSQWPRHILDILKDIQKAISSKSKRAQGLLPDILTESLLRWRNTARFSGLFESKKKKFQIYQRIFLQNEEIFFFNSKEENMLNVNYFSKKYGENYIRSVQLDTPALREFGEVVNEVLNEYLNVIAKTSVFAAGKNTKSSHNSLSAIYQTPTHQSHSRQLPNQEAYHPFKITHPSNKKNGNGIIPQTNAKQNQSSFKEKTPRKKNRGQQTRRYNVTPTQKPTKMSPLIQRHFGSTDKSLSRSKNMTPTKSYTTGPYGLIGHATQVYKNSKKEGLQKDSVYQKLFFFRNKRVESFDIVMKRLRGR